MRKNTYPRACTQCGVVKDESGFYVKYKKTGARFSDCIQCRAKRASQKWQSMAQEGRDRLNERRRRRHAELHPPRVPKGKDPVLARQARARYRQNHREEVRERGRAEYQSNPDRFKRHLAMRRARERNATGSFTVPEWRALCAKYEHRCLWCGSTGKSLSPDHVVPLSQGGSNDISNIQPLCAPCNLRKHRKTLDFRPR